MKRISNISPCGGSPEGRQYPIFLLFLVIYSLFFAAVPVLAEEAKDPCIGATCPSIENPSAFLPSCVYYEGNTQQVGGAAATVEQCCGCRNVNVLVSLLTKIANWLFGIVGAVALAVFIYGGFTILTAAGSAERVKKGKDALIAAVIGLVIVFTAQMGLKFLLKTVLTKTKGETATSTPATIEKGLFINVPEKTED